VYVDVEIIKNKYKIDVLIYVNMVLFLIKMDTVTLALLIKSWMYTATSASVSQDINVSMEYAGLIA
jgi:hypothetical protein